MSQHGFYQKRSCLTNILEFMEDVTSSLNRHKYVDVVFLDFQKAFDKVPHQRILLKLKSIWVSLVIYCLGSSIGFVIGNRGWL